MADTATQTRYRVEGMDCAGCAAKIDTAVRRLPGIEEVSVSATAGTMTVLHNGQSDLAQIERAVTGLGYGIAPTRQAIPVREVDAKHDHAGHDHGPELHGHDRAPTTGPWWHSSKAKLTAAGVAIIVAYGVGKLAPAVALWAFIAAMLVGLAPIAQRAFMAARVKKRQRSYFCFSSASCWKASRPDARAPAFRALQLWRRKPPLSKPTAALRKCRRSLSLWA